MEQLQKVADDADAYDTEAEDEADRLEESLLEERFAGEAKAGAPAGDGKTGKTVASAL